MTSAGVKGLNLFSGASLSAGNSAKVESTENFNDTFQSMRADKSDMKEQIQSTDNKECDNTKVDEMTSTKTRNPVRPEEEVTDEQMAAMSDEIVSQIKQVIMNELDVTEEELNETITQMGLIDESLLNPSDLSQLVMRLEGIESQGDMLTNPDFAKNLKNILAAMEQIKENVTVENIQIEENITEAVGESVPEEIVEETVSKETETTVENEVTDTEMAVENTETVVTDTQREEQSLMDSQSGEQKGLLQHKETKDTVTNDNGIAENHMMTAQDFAAKLTEDLSKEVGEVKANDIVRQVVEQASVQVKQGITSMEMQLYPEHLGKVLIQVSTHDGQVTAQITAESEAAKTALESQLTLLKENLNNQGLKIENVEVTIASHAFEQNMQGERGQEEQTSHSRKTRRNIGSFFDDESDDGSSIEQEKIMEITGSTVSYSA